MTRASLLLLVLSLVSCGSSVRVDPGPPPGTDAGCASECFATCTTCSVVMTCWPTDAGDAGVCCLCR